jgi:hypothetical protein
MGEEIMEKYIVDVSTKDLNLEVEVRAYSINNAIAIFNTLYPHLASCYKSVTLVTPAVSGWRP